jgi:predicted NAD-dependent protein-ADP-ribosyltransferase YbiA (DUF1768 family)
MGGPAYIDGVEIKEFGNFYPCRFKCWGVEFTSVEQAFQYAKSEDPAYRSSILACSDPMEAWKLGRKCASLDPKWEQLKVFRMFTCMYERFSQDQAMCDKLVDSYPKDITFQHAQEKDDWDEFNALALKTVRVFLQRERTSTHVAYGLGSALTVLLCLTAWVLF